MKIRQMPYGYMIQDGHYTHKTDEASAVREVFRLYMRGLSYREISGIMNNSGCPPYSASGWNKHHIKRMLENRRYLGEGVYPAIITEEDFNTVKTIRDKKVVATETANTPSDILWKNIICADCGHRLVRTGCKKPEQGMAWLLCKNPECHTRIRLRNMDLYSTVCKLMIKASDMTAAQYKPSLEAIKLDSRISRALMKPDDPAEAVRLILQGIDARYAGIPAPPPKQNNDEENRLFEPDWKVFKEAVSHISLSPTKVGLKTISGREFSTGRNDDYAESDTAPAGSDGDSRQSRS